MATKMENLALELAHWHNFYQQLPGRTKWDPATVAELLKLGIIEVSTAYEHALAELGGCEVISEDWADLSNGDDAKLSSVRTSSNGKNYSAPITNISGKTGALRVQVYERKQDQFYYFIIPNWAFQHIPKSSNIEIPFELDGTPRRRNLCAVNWWQFEADSFESMACNPAMVDRADKFAILYED